MVPLVEYGWAAEYPGDNRAYDDFEKFLRIEFAQRHPGWEPSFGRVSRYDRPAGRWDYGFLLTGSVPDASSKRDAEDRVRGLLDDLKQRMQGTQEKLARALPEPVVRVWQR